MGTKLKVVLCDEHGIGGSGEYFGDNDAHLDITNVFYDEASSGKYLPRAVLFNLEPSVMDAVRTSSLGCLICLYSTFIGMISSKIASKIDGIVLQCRRGIIRPGINLVGKTGLKTTTKELTSRADSSATRARERLPAAFASVPLGFVLNRVF